MDINILKTFIEVYRTGHFGKAADNLFVTQSTVSARIRLLENELSARLFYRNRNNIQLTPSGRRFLKHAEAMLATWNRARFDITVDSERKSPLAIGGLPGLWEIYLGHWLVKAKKLYPEISFIAEAASADTLIRRIYDHSIDVGFVYDIPPDPDINAVEAQSFELVMVSSGECRDPREAFASDYVYVDWGASFFGQHSRHFPEAPAPELKTDLGRVALDYLRENGGSAYLPQPLVNDDLRQGRLYRINGAPAINRTSFAIFHENSEQRELVQKLISMHQRH